jgi:hypothetical protein
MLESSVPKLKRVQAKEREKQDLSKAVLHDHLLKTQE